MLFTGEYDHAMDDKQRISLPADIRARLDREQDGEGFYAVLGANGAVWLWPDRPFARMVSGQGDGSGLPGFLRSEEWAEFEELFFSQAAPVGVDSQGRIRLPERLARMAKLESLVSVLGVRDHLEIWDRATWTAYRDARMTQYRDVLARARATMQRGTHGT